MNEIEEADIGREMRMKFKKGDKVRDKLTGKVYVLGELSGYYRQPGYWAAEWTLKEVPLEKIGARLLLDHFEKVD